MVTVATTTFLPIPGEGPTTRHWGVGPDGHDPDGVVYWVGETQLCGWVVASSGQGSQMCCASVPVLTLSGAGAGLGRCSGALSYLGLDPYGSLKLPSGLKRRHRRALGRAYTTVLLQSKQPQLSGLKSWIILDYDNGLIPAIKFISSPQNDNQM